MNIIELPSWWHAVTLLDIFLGGATIYVYICIYVYMYTYVYCEFLNIARCISSTKKWILLSCQSIIPQKGHFDHMVHANSNTWLRAHIKGEAAGGFIAWPLLLCSGSICRTWRPWLRIWTSVATWQWPVAAWGKSSVRALEGLCGERTTSVNSHSQY